MVYYLVVPFLYLLSWLPMGVLYLLADVTAFVLRVVVRYRRKVVMQNLCNSFPEKSEAELNTVAGDFYHNLADRMVEGIKCISISREDILKRCPVENYQLVESYCKQGRSVVAVLGHCGSWEMACLSSSIYIDKYTKYSIYTAGRNKQFDDFLKRTRGRFGMQLISMQQTPHYLRHGFGGVSVGMYLADQNHSNPKRAYWTKFLHQDTPFMTGAARFAKAHNSVLLFVKVKQLKRGYYSIENITLEENPNNFTEQQLTEKFVKALEQQIQERPADWLWSHKRWKHKR